MNRITKLVLLLVVCTLIALWSPWVNWKFDLSSVFGIQAPEEISGLQVYSLSGELEIFIDNASVGKVDEENSPLIVDRIAPGEHLLTLKRVSEVKNAYWSVNKMITFESGTNVVASYNLGPEEEFSEGHIIYAVKKISPTVDTILNITTNIEDSTVRIDTNQPLQSVGNLFSSKLELNQQHNISIYKDGYEKLDFTILPSSQEERDKLRDFNLNIEAHLMLQPVEVE